MPTSAPRRCSGCQQLVSGDCPNCSAWKRKPPSWSGLTDAELGAWRKFRLAWLRDHPLCMDCGKPATRVCHFPGIDYGRDRCNPAAIEGQRCRACDAIETGRQGRAAHVKRGV